MTKPLYWIPYILLKLIYWSNSYNPPYNFYSSLNKAKKSNWVPNRFYLRFSISIPTKPTNFNNYTKTAIYLTHTHKIYSHTTPATCSRLILSYVLPPLRQDNPCTSVHSCALFDQTKSSLSISTTWYILMDMLLYNDDDDDDDGDDGGGGGGGRLFT